MAAMVFVLIDTWRVGRRVHVDHMRGDTLPLDLFLERAPAARVAGTAIFLAARTDVVPGPLLHSLKHYKVMHERVVLASISVEGVPFVPPERRVEVTKLGKGFFETPDVPGALERCRALGLALDPDTSTFFLGRETLVPGEHPDLRSWRIALYTWLASNALAPAGYFQLPPNRVVELGTQITI
jgi:KUP system potassium uptake protein